MKKKLLWMLSLFGLLSAPMATRADEGMWLPLFLETYNMERMRELGLKLTAEEIYSVNHHSLKDAVMIFGGGCTGELISDQGLLITNHHCGFGEIQAHSTLQHDYLTDGFWAMSKAEELPNPGLSVQFLIRMEDVTQKVLEGIDLETPESQREALIEQRTAQLARQATEGTHYEAYVVPFFGGNEFYLFVEEVFRDVRLVGAPPSAIGKFGGDTDNWMWPRHTGDFSLFRIYAGPDNLPADYSPNNQPYQPRKHFPISLTGGQPGDFTMVFGYPGSTRQYLSSYAVQSIIGTQNPNRIAIRDAKLQIIGQAMESDPGVRIQYAAKQAGVANAWKKWIGESRGLERLDAVAKKQQLEASFLEWAKADPNRQALYGNLLRQYRDAYEQWTPLELAANYFIECGWQLEPLQAAHRFGEFGRISEEEQLEKIEALANYPADHFKNIHLPTDQRITRAMLQLYFQNQTGAWRPAILEQLIQTEFKGELDKFVDEIYRKSIFTDPARLAAFIQNYEPSKSLKVLQKDLVFRLYEGLINHYRQIDAQIAPIEADIARLDRYYIRGLREMFPDKNFYPDANFTLRVAYGQVATYEPADGVVYQTYTTLDGIMAKDNPEIYDYRVPQRLKELHQSKDFGRYAMDGEMRVCFIASNHTTGGNSGSPVIDGNGNLIGVNFDRCWEGTMSDIMYDPEQCRNITLDIRYALFIIDKFAGAGHLVQEMSIVQ